MAEVTYTAVAWTAGDTITEAKLDNMVANDRAVDAMYNGIEFTERADPSTPGANKIHVYAKDKNGIPTIYAINDAGTVYELSETTPMFTFTVTGTLVTGTNQTPGLIVPKDNLTIVKAYLYVKTVNTGASLIVDVNKNGTSIWASTQANRLTLAAADADGKTTQTSFDTTDIDEQDILTIDIDQVGSTIAGADLTIGIKTK